MNLLNLITADAAESTKTALRLLHLGGLVLGLGAATLLDLIILRFAVSRRVRVEHVKIIHFSASVVTVGLIFLWLSGAGFLLHYLHFDPTKLSNPKIWAKISIVAILTANGFLIHKAILPLVNAQVGRTLFDGVTHGRRMFFISAGVVSGVSWYIPLLLGAIAQLNFVVPFTTIFGFYVVALLISIIFAAAVTALLLMDSPVKSTFLLVWPTTLARGTMPAAGCAAIIVANVLVASLDSYSFGRSSFNDTAGASAPSSGSPDIINLSAAGVEENAKPELAPVAIASATIINPEIESAQESPPAKHPLPPSDQTTKVPHLNEIKISKPPLSYLDPTSTSTTKPQAKPDFSNKDGFHQIAGVWAADRSACIAPASSNFIRVAIDTKGAEAGGTYCAFEKVWQSEDGWTSRVSCSQGSQRWISNVELSLKRNRLLWKSERGSQLYYFCADFIGKTHTGSRVGAFRSQ